MSTNPGPTTTYRHNICGSMADRHDSGPGIIRCGDVPLNEVYRKQILNVIQKIDDPQFLKRILNLANYLYTQL